MSLVFRHIGKTYVFFPRTFPNFAHTTVENR